MSETTKIIKADPSDAGCWVDGHWGQYASANVIEMAAAHGWDDAEALGLAQKHLASMGPSTSEELSDEEFSTMMAAIDEAEEWLNENVAPEGFSFGWFDGEFFLMSEEWWSED